MTTRLELGPVWAGGRSVLDQSCTHFTSGLGWPAFDDAFAEGLAIIAPEPLVVIPNPVTGAAWSSSNPGLAFYARGASGLLYWYGHLDARHAPGTHFAAGDYMARVAPNNVGGGPHVHVAIDARPVLGRHLESGRNYTLGAPTIGEQLAAYFDAQEPANFWAWLRWRLGEGEFKPYGPASPRHRPNVPARIPSAWWQRLKGFLAARSDESRQAAAAAEVEERLAWARWNRDGGRPWQRPANVRQRIPADWWDWYRGWIADNPWPRPLPKWYWEWQAWIDRGRTGPRPASAPRTIPQWAWERDRARRAAK